jgi:hypothetical protein
MAVFVGSCCSSRLATLHIMDNRVVEDLSDGCVLACLLPACVVLPFRYDAMLAEQQYGAVEEQPQAAAGYEAAAEQQPVA